jgi:ATP-dependent RNA helicase RhlE
LVFTRTKRRADKVAKALSRAGHKTAVIHADRSQSQRRTALESFRAGEVRVLVATDIAARGIDVAEIGHVVNFDLPHVPEDYVHRIGRTARASASGRASSFAAPDEHDLLRGIEKFTRKPVDRAVVPREDEAFRNELTRRADEPAERGRRRGGGGGGRPQGGGQQRRSGGSGGGQRAGGQQRRSGGASHASKPSAEGGQSQPVQKLGSWKPRRR